MAAVLLSAVALLPLAAAPAGADPATGTITGHLTGRFGGVHAYWSVERWNDSTQAWESFCCSWDPYGSPPSTGSDGGFTVADVTPGTYVIEFRYQASHCGPCYDDFDVRGTSESLPTPGSPEAVGYPGLVVVPDDGLPTHVVEVHATVPSLSGRLVDDRGRPVVGATVSTNVKAGPSDYAQAITGPRGWFAMKNGRGFWSTLEVTKPDGSAWWLGSRHAEGPPVDGSLVHSDAMHTRLGVLDVDHYRRKAPTTTVVDPASLRIHEGERPEVTATVSVPREDPFGPDGGTLRIREAGRLLVAEDTMGTGDATLRLPALPVGVHHLVVRFSGRPDYARSQTPLRVRVVPAG